MKKYFSGFIRIAKPLDYEEIKKYNLVVAAWDGEFGNKTNVEITVINVNDMKPKFEKEKYVVKEEEERVPQYPIFQVNFRFCSSNIFKIKRRF
jgi:hypothetical protein